MSDYIYRGLTLTDHGPAALADLHYNFDFGLSFGASAANTGADEARGMQARVDISYVYPLSSLFALKTKVGYFYNPFATQADMLDFQIGAQITKYFQLTGYFSPKYNATGKSATRIEGESDIEVLPSEHLFLNLLAAYNKFADEIRAGNTSYFDYKIALHKKIDQHDIGLFWVGTNRRIVDGIKVDTRAKDEAFGATYTLRVN